MLKYVDPLIEAGLEQLSPPLAAVRRMVRQASGPSQPGGYGPNPRRRRLQPINRPYYRALNLRYPRMLYRGCPMGVKKVSSTCLETGYTTLNNPAATSVHYSFKMNSLDDPLGTLAAVQPKFKDQWYAMYDRGMVRGGSIKFIVDTTQTHQIYMGWYYSNSNAAPAGYSGQILTGYPGHKMRQILKAEQLPITLSSKFRSNMLREMETVTDDNYGAASGADPNIVLYGHLVFFSSDAATNLTNLNIRVVMRQYCNFYGKKIVDDA